jgi:hypothetical protein
MRMRLSFTKVRLCLVLSGLMLATAASLSAQTVTTGTITGVVKDSQGGVLPGATVTATHVPTGTLYEAVTQGDGRFTMLAVRVGGPYVVKAAMSGFKTQEQKDLAVSLGEERDVPFTLQIESVQETVTVVAEAQVIETTRAGTADNVKAQALEALPTVSRSLTDFARTSPYFNASTDNRGSSADVISVAGRSNRYNNIQIDGAVNNDLFGLAEGSGLPGGSAGTQPVSLDAIAELQLVVSPYDVRQGGFSGGGINAITKSGSNDLKGSGYYYFRNQDWVGKGPTGNPIATFSDKQGGFSAGGPVLRNRTFFFSNLDFGRKQTPVGYSADGQSGRNWADPAVNSRLQQLNDVVNILKTQYGYDPWGDVGDPLAEFVKGTNNNKFFLRGDVNLSTKHRVTARYNYIDAFSDTQSQDSTSYRLPDNAYKFLSKQHSFVTQVNSTFGRAFNEFRVTVQRIRERRETATQFPQVQVDFTDGSYVRTGAEEFSAANALDQDILELTDDFTMVRGKHTITVGTHNEFFRFTNLFTADAWGAYRFTSVANFAAGLASGYTYRYSNTGDPDWAASFPVHQFGLYAGDQWRVAPKFTVTYGIRWDAPRFPDKPGDNSETVTRFGYSTTATPSPASWSPRAGFNWDLSTGKARQQVRGGFGLFSGRTPYVWLSNQYSNTGLEFTVPALSYSSNNCKGSAPCVPFVPDINAQPRNLAGASTKEVNLIDPDYQYPSLIRGNLAFDRDLGILGLRGTVEYLFSRVVNDIKYQNLNLVQNGNLPDGREVWKVRYSDYLGAYLLENTDKGSQWSVAFKVDRPWRNSFYVSGSYLYGRSYSVMDGTSSRAVSNWNGVYVPGNPNNPPLSRANFDPGHRVTLQASYDIPVYRQFKVTASIYYNGQSGRLYSTIFNGDVNRDARSTNDLFYVPRSADEIVIQNGTWDQLNAYVQNDPALAANVGKIVARNTARGPWWNNADAKFTFNVPTGRRFKGEVTFDILNFMNMFDRKWGNYYYPNFQDLIPVRSVTGGIDSATGKQIYNLSPLNNGAIKTPQDLMTLEDLRSRFQAQLGLRLRF